MSLIRYNRTPWAEPEELCEMFSIPDSFGRQLWCALVWCTAVGRRHRFGSVDQFAGALRRQQQLSPAVFWSTVRRGIGPMLEADPDTLRALGLPVGDDLSSRALADAAAWAMYYSPDFDPTAETAGEVRRSMQRGFDDGWDRKAGHS